VVESVICYIYHSNLAQEGYGMGFYDELVLCTQIYIFADSILLPGLKEKAVERFKEELDPDIYTPASETIVAITRYLYKNEQNFPVKGTPFHQALIDCIAAHIHNTSYGEKTSELLLAGLPSLAVGLCTALQKFVGHRIEVAQLSAMDHWVDEYNGKHYILRCNVCRRDVLVKMRISYDSTEARHEPCCSKCYNVI